MFDWNNNGKYDMEDAFIDYHIDKSMRSDKSEESGPGVDELVIVRILGVGLLLLLILGLISVSS